MDKPLVVSFSNGRVQQQPMLEGFERVAVNQGEGEEIIKGLSVKELQESSINLRSIEGVSNQNAEKLKEHDATLKRWNDNVETVRAMCADELDKSVNDQLKIAIKENDDAKKYITFDENKGVFFYKNGNQTAKFKVIQGRNGKHLLQITISGRLSQEELENRIEKVVSELSKYGNVEEQESGDGKRTLNLNGTEIILPSKMGKNSRVSFKLEHNRIHFQGENYKNDMENVFGKNNVPFNASGNFPVKEKTSDGIWRDQCMRQVKSMISPMVGLDEEYSETLNDIGIKAPVSCYLNLLSMNIMLNSILENYNNSDDFDEPVVAYDKSVVSIAGNLSVVINDGEEDSFQSWINTLNSVHQAYGEYTKRIVDLKCNCGRNNTTFVAEEAVLRQHEALLRKLFVEATNRAEKVLKLDILSQASNIHLLDKEEISDMEFSSASEIMSNVIQMFVQKHADEQRALELEKKEEERRAKAEESQQEIAKLSEEVRGLRETVKKRDDQIRELITQLDDGKKTSKATIEGLKGQIDGLSEIIKQQTEKIDELNQMIAQKSKETQDKVSGLEEKILKLNRTLKERNEKIAKLEKSIEELKSQIKELRENAVQKASDDNSAGPMNVNSVNYVNSNGVYGMQPVDDDMKDKVEELESKYAELQKRCEEQENEIARLRKDLDGLKVERDDWKRKYDDREKELNEIANNGFDGAQKLNAKVNAAKEVLKQNEIKHIEIAKGLLDFNFDDI